MYKQKNEDLSQKTHLEHKHWALME